MGSEMCIRDRCVTQSLGALKDKRVGLIARAHGDTTTPAGVNLSFYNGSACGNERSPRIERGGRMIRASVHFVLMCEPSALSPELVSWTHTEATCSWEFGFRYGPQHDWVTPQTPHLTLHMHIPIYRWSPRSSTRPSTTTAPTRGTSISEI